MDKLKQQHELQELKKDYAHYQRLIPNAVEYKKQAIADGRNIAAKAVDHRLKFFKQQSQVLKQNINEIEQRNTLQLTRETENAYI